MRKRALLPGDPSPMTWYRSLYWRIAFGVVAFLAAMLVVQAMLFVWAVSQSGRSLPGQSPGRLGQTVALDLGERAGAQPAGGPRSVHPRAVRAVHASVLRDDGRRPGHHERQPVLSRPAPRHGARATAAANRTSRTARVPPRPDGPGDARGRPGRSGGPRPGRPDADDRPGFLRGLFGRGGDRFERDPTGFRYVRPSPVLVNGRLAAVVVVPPQAPFGFLLGRYAPMLAFVAAGVLVLGAVLTSR